MQGTNRCVNTPNYISAKSERICHFPKQIGERNRGKCVNSPSYIIRNKKRFKSPPYKCKENPRVSEDPSINVWKDGMCNYYSLHKCNGETMVS